MYPWLMRFEDSGRETFWYGLESGIPEIQAWSLMHLAYPHVDIPKYAGEVLASYGDLTSIPWTEAIREKIRDYCRSELEEKVDVRTSKLLSELKGSRTWEKLFFLFGFVGGKLVPENDKTLLWYYAGKLTALTRDNDVTEKNEECEVIVEEIRNSWMNRYLIQICITSGYLYPLLSEIVEYRKNINATFLMWRYSFYYARAPVLPAILGSFGSEAPILEIFLDIYPTRKLAARMQAILENPDLQTVTVKYRELYRIMTGIQTGLRASMEWRINAGVPGPSVTAQKPTSTVVQGRVVYSAKFLHVFDPIWSYIRGQALYDYPYTTSRAGPAPYSGEMMQRYNSILLLLHQSR